MKKTIGILFALAIAIPLLLPAWFLAQQQTLRKQAKEKLKTSLLQTIRVEKDQLVWVRAGKEIRTNGHLFDVKQIIDRGSHFEITGLYDRQEDLLHAQLDHWQQNQDKQTNKLLAAVFLQLLYNEQQGSDTAPFPLLRNTGFNEFRNPSLAYPYIGQLIPPPDC